MNTHFFMDAFFATKKTTKSTREKTCCQISVIDKSFVHVELWREKSDLIHTLKILAKEIGFLEAIIVDSAPEENSSEVKKICNQIIISHRMLEKGTPWSNLARNYIGIFKYSCCKDLKASDLPIVLWDYCVDQRSRIENVTAWDLCQLMGTNSYAIFYGKECGISNLCQFDWYE